MRIEERNRSTCEIDLKARAAALCDLDHVSCLKFFYTQTPFAPLPNHKNKNQTVPTKWSKMAPPRTANFPDVGQDWAWCRGENGGSSDWDDSAFLLGRYARRIGRESRRGEDICGLVLMAGFHCLTSKHKEKEKTKKGKEKKDKRPFLTSTSLPHLDVPSLNRLHRQDWLGLDNGQSWKCINVMDIQLSGRNLDNAESA